MFLPSFILLILDILLGTTCQSLTIGKSYPCDFLAPVSGIWCNTGNNDKITKWRECMLSTLTGSFLILGISSVHLTDAITHPLWCLVPNNLSPLTILILHSQCPGKTSQKLLPWASPTFSSRFLLVSFSQCFSPGSTDFLLSDLCSWCLGHLEVFLPNSPLPQSSLWIIPSESNFFLLQVSLTFSLHLSHKFLTGVTYHNVQVTPYLPHQTTTEVRDSNWWIQLALPAAIGTGLCIDCTQHRFI